MKLYQNKTTLITLRYLVTIKSISYFKKQKEVIKMNMMINVGLQSSWSEQIGQTYKMMAFSSFRGIK